MAPRLAILTLLLAAWQSSAVAQTVGSAVLLKNDRTLMGAVEAQGNSYTVRMSKLSKVSLPADQVLYVGKNKEDLYEFKKANIRNWRTGDHFQITRWCLQNELYEQAANHYQQVAKDYPNHPRVKQLALEIRNKLLELPEFRAYLGLQPIESTVQEPVQLAEDKPQVAKPGVVTASASFDSTAMHPEIAAHFSRRIQPILVNRCSQAACHGAQSKNGLKILEPYRAKFEQLSSDNLRSVMGHVSADKDQLSPLLRFATTAHGLQRQAGISITETQLLSEITNWIQFIQNPVTNTIAYSQSNAIPQVQTAAATQFIPFTPGVRLVPVQPGSSGLKPVPAVGGVPGSAQGFPDGDVPLSSEIDALDQRLRQILGEGPSTNPALAPSGAPQNRRMPSTQRNSTGELPKPNLGPDLAALIQASCAKFAEAPKADDAFWHLLTPGDARRPGFWLLSNLPTICLGAVAGLWVGIKI